MKKQRKNKQDIKNTIKTNKAITLIALVVTIVVLLILATVSIQMLGGEDGIIKQAVDAKDKTKEANAKEQIGVEVTGSYGIDGKIDIPLLNENLGHIDGITHDGQSLADNPITSLPAIVELDGIKVVINGDGSTNNVPEYAGKTYETETDITIGNTPVTIPGGATVSGIPGEYETIDDGIVIYVIPEGEPEITDWKADSDNNGIIDVQEKYDQFVWVPVPNAVLDLSSNTTALSTEANIKAAVQSEIDAGRYPMVIKKDSTNYLGVLYKFSLDSTTNAVKVEPDSSWTPLCETNTYYREPSAVTSYDTSSYLPQVNGILNTSYSDSTSFANALQVEFNTMVNRVASNKGFWVGRYETSGMNNSTTTTYASSNEIKVNVVKGTTTGIGSVTWYRMYAQQKNYAKLALGNTTTATSSMIWGSQWDQIMIWMKGVKNETSYAGSMPYYILNSQGMGNFGTSAGGTGSIAKTGYYAVKNVYDLAGNVYDWTLEAFTTDGRDPRGGFYNGTGSSGTRADGRFYGGPFDSDTFYGSRSTLY